MIKARTWKVANTALESRLEAPSGLRRHNQALVAPCHAARRPNHIKRPVLSRKTGVIPRGKEFPGKRGETCLELLGYAFGSHRLLCYRLMCVCPSACGRTIDVGWSRRSPPLETVSKKTRIRWLQRRGISRLGTFGCEYAVVGAGTRPVTNPTRVSGCMGSNIQIKHGNSEKLLCTGRWGIVLPRGGHGAIHGAYSSRSRALPLHVSTPVSTSDHLEHAKHVKPTTSADQDWLL